MAHPIEIMPLEIVLDEDTLRKWIDWIWTQSDDDNEHGHKGIAHLLHTILLHGSLHREPTDIIIYNFRDGEEVIADYDEEYAEYLDYLARQPNLIDNVDTWKSRYPDDENMPAGTSIDEEE